MPRAPVTPLAIHWLVLPVFAALIGTARTAAAPSAPQPTPAAITQHQVLPFLQLRCAACHGARRQEGGLDVRTRAGLLKGGKSGPAIVLGDPASSLLLRKIRSGEMPPPRRVVEVSVKPMEPAEAELVARWIGQRAPEAPEPPEPPTRVTQAEKAFWSFRPPREVTPPRFEPAAGAANPVDAFLLQRLRAVGLGFAPEADRPSLLRRVTFDLTGLPPTPAEARAFLVDREPGAYERVVDRLLASPRYGERWARHWLDLAGYSDSEGIQDADPIRPDAYRYRDYVVRALNADKPYDRFLLEQIAGDELADYERAPEITPELADNLIATGFLRLTTDGTFSNITAFVPDRLDTISDELTVLSSSVMGLTLRCARCHDHKFDPISQRDYYRLTAVFKGAYDENDWLSPHAGDKPSGDLARFRLLPYVTTAERRAWQERERLRIEQLQAERNGLSQAAAAARARIGPAAPRDEGELRKADAAYRAVAEAAEARIKKLDEAREGEPLIRALWDRGEPSPTYLLLRGDYLKPGMPVRPGVPEVLADSHAPYVASPPWPGARKTGRRLAFARWLVRPGHPLTGRVLVNRVWKHHFGAGLVRTLENFGRTGDRPTHPELLDWLAVRFVRPQRDGGMGWSLKRLHRLLVTTRAYRQGSTVAGQAARVDPQNHLLSRMRLRRLDAEEVYDSLLAVSGRLDERPGGPPDRLEVRADGLVLAAGRTEPGAEGPVWRRSLYVLQRRKTPLSLLEAFDLPQMSPNCVSRASSTVAPQALHLLNNSRVRQLSEAFARRLGDASEPGRQVEEASWLALGRPPTSAERATGLASLNSLTRAWASAAGDQASRRALVSYCHALLNSAGFLYVD